MPAARRRLCEQPMGGNLPMRPCVRRPAALAISLLLLVPATALAFPLTSCSLSLTSLAADGRTLDTATGGADDATQADPFVVDWDGTVRWEGTTGAQTIRDNTWHVDVFGFPTPLRGGDPNEGGNRDDADTITVSASAPFRFTGLFYVAGEFTGAGGSCSGGGWLKVAGDPVGTVPFFAALALLVLGVVMLAVGMRGNVALAVVGGFFGGLGLAMLLIMFAVLPLGAATPMALLLIGLAVGVATGWIGRRQSRAAGDRLRG
jgi:hypothetical protein